MAKRGDNARDDHDTRNPKRSVSKSYLRRLALQPTSPLDKDLRKIERLEEATRAVSRNWVALGIALLFLVTVGILAGRQVDAGQNSLLLIVATVIGGYMALTIGANDVANNVGPAVGARALTMTGALALAALFECSGALIAGRDVVQTISEDLIDPALVPSSQVFIWIMISALLASALWVHLATFLGAPISTTHAVVGGVLGAGLAGVGASAIDWSVVAQIFASWMTAPVVAGLLAAGLVAFIEATLIYQEDKITAARLWVPVLVALMAAVFFAYIASEVLSRVWAPGRLLIVVASFAVFGLVYAGATAWVKSESKGMENRNQSVRALFRMPLIFAACLLSFAHGSNDVANAVGPLAAVLDNAMSGEILGQASVPFWVMAIGATGISIGLFLFGPRIVRIVGEQITRMNPTRAFCVALAAASTVLVASQLGMPVSTTQTVVGAVFGIGFYREYASARSRRRRYYILRNKGRRMRAIRPVTQDELRRRRLVRRSHVIGIVATWAITLPSAALMAALIYRGVDWIR